jgi:hypothetical protein
MLEEDVGGVFDVGKKKYRESIDSYNNSELGL